MSTRVIAIISQKGGSGKSTLAINIASAAHKRGLKVAIADTDPQQSVYLWYEKRAAKRPLPVAKSVFTSGIPAFIALARQNGIDLVVIDTSPNSTEESISLAEAADLVIVPTAPSTLDIRALRRTANIIRAVNAPALVVLNKTPPRGSRVSQARRALSSPPPQGYGLQVASAQIGQRTANQDAYSASTTIHEFDPDGLPAAEFDSLFREICRHPVIDIDLPAPLARRNPRKAATKASPPDRSTKKAKAHV